MWAMFLTSSTFAFATPHCNCWSQLASSTSVHYIHYIYTYVHYCIDIVDHLNRKGQGQTFLSSSPPESPRMHHNRKLDRIHDESGERNGYYNTRIDNDNIDNERVREHKGKDRINREKQEWQRDGRERHERDYDRKHFPAGPGDHPGGNPHGGRSSYDPRDYNGRDYPPNDNSRTGRDYHDGKEYYTDAGKHDHGKNYNPGVGYLYPKEQGYYMNTAGQSREPPPHEKRASWIHGIL